MEIIKLYDPIGLVTEQLKEMGYKIDSSPSKEHSMVVYPDEMLIEEFGFVPVVQNMKPVEYSDSIDEMLTRLQESAKSPDCVQKSDKNAPVKYLTGELPTPAVDVKTTGMNELEMAIQAAINKVNNGEDLVPGKSIPETKVQKHKTPKPVEKVVEKVVVADNCEEETEPTKPIKTESILPDPVTKDYTSYDVSLESLERIIQDKLQAFGKSIALTIFNELSATKTSEVTHVEEQKQAVEKTPDEKVVVPPKVVRKPVETCNADYSDNDLDSLRKQKQELDAKIKDARSSGDAERVDELRKERRHVRNQINKCLANGD